MENFRAFFRVIGICAFSFSLVPTSALATSEIDYFSCAIGPNFYDSEGFDFSFDLETRNVVLRNFTDGAQGHDFRVVAGELEGGGLFFTVEFIFDNYVEMRDEIYIDLTEMDLVLSGALYDEDGSFAGVKADLSGKCKYTSLEEFEAGA
jgi:hypothetical protein